MLRQDRILFLPKLLYSSVLCNCVTAELFVHVHRNVEDKQHFMRISVHAQFNLWTAQKHCRFKLLEMTFLRNSSGHAAKPTAASCWVLSDLLGMAEHVMSSRPVIDHFFLWIVISKGSDVHGKEPSKFPTAWQVEKSSRKEVANITLTWGKHAGNFRLTLPSRSDL